jgi:AcrR family transcriptional regulator
MSGTKEKIIAESKDLFFATGIANTRLQQIADACSISVGNLAYHFKNKEAIVEAVYDNLFEELSSILSQYINHKHLQGFDILFSRLYFFYEHNRFTFNNTWEIERNHPEIQKEWLTVNNKILQQLKRKIQVCQQDEIFKPEPLKGNYDLLAHSLLILINSWIPQQILRQMPVTEKLYKNCLWNLLYPNFSKKGASIYHEIIVPERFI